MYQFIHHDQKKKLEVGFDRDREFVVVIAQVLTRSPSPMSSLDSKRIACVLTYRLTESSEAEL